MGIRDNCQEFDCAECRRHVIKMIATPVLYPLCAQCQFTPGWFEDDAIRAVIDPGMVYPFPPPCAPEPPPV